MIPSRPLASFLLVLSLSAPARPQSCGGAVAPCPPPGTAQPFVCASPDGAGNVRRCYAPPELAVPHANHVLTVFYPPTGVPPAGGWPVILHSGAANFLAADPLELLVAAPSGTADLYQACLHGWCIISVGTTGLLSTGSDFPNLFRDYGSPEWNDFSKYWGEKEFAWARQWVAENAATLGVNNDRVVPWGVSTGAVYGASVALGPRRVFATATSAQSQRDTRCAGLVAFALPTWIGAHQQSVTSFYRHWPTAAGLPPLPGQVADPEIIKRASPSRWVRELASYAADTPVLFLYDEGLGSTDFGRDAVTGDPTLTDAIDWIAFLHAGWFGLTLRYDLETVASGFHADRSRLALSASLAAAVASLPDEPYKSYGDVVFQGTLFASGDLSLHVCDWLTSQVGGGGSAAIRNGSGANPLAYGTCEIPSIGNTWDAVVSPGGYYPGQTATAVLVLAYSAEFDPGVSLIYGELLINIASTQLAADVKPAGSPIALPIPALSSLIGLHVFTQGAILGSGIPRLVNAIELVIG